MRRFIRAILPVLVIGAGVLIAWAIFVSRPTPTPKTPDILPPSVQTLRVAPETHRFVVDSQGTVTPRTELPLVAEVGGRIIATADDFDDGGFFEKGELLVEIDPTDYRLALTRALAEVRQAELNLEVQRADAEVARTEWKRLNESDPPPLVAREPQVAQAEAGLEAARAAVESARRDLERTRITAPFDGRVRTASVDVGQVVARGSVCGMIYAVDYVEIKLPLATDEFAYLELPMRYRNAVDPSGDEDAGGDDVAGVRLTADLAGARHTWTGRIVRTDGAIDPTSRRLAVIVRVDDPYARSVENPERPPLAVGLFVDAAIQGRVIDDVYVLPRAALRQGDAIFVVDDDDRLRIRPVRVLRRTRERIVIGEGLEPGQRVVVSPIEAPVDSMKVRPHEGDGLARDPGDDLIPGTGDDRAPERIGDEAAEGAEK
jgi:RND family efflux transporter MFP subunit